MDSINIPCRQCPVLPMCKHRFEIECVHIYRYLFSIRGIKSLDTDGLKIIGDTFNKRCIRVSPYAIDPMDHFGNPCIFINFEDGRVLEVREG